MDRNKHIKDYVAYYTAFPHPPRFAVMLSGPWGIGKTFLLKSLLKPPPGEERKYIYVSLYGLASFDEVDDALFRAMYPMLDHKGVQIAGRAVKAIGKYLRIDPDVKSRDFLNTSNVDLFVFDDLERCEIPTNKVLGYINQFVEHDDCKVIIIANENEIKDQDNYSRIREKLIGKTLEIQSAFEEALAAFTSLINDAPTKDVLIAKANEIASIYEQAGLHNLRILQQTMWDFERFFAALSDTHRKNDGAVTSLLRIIFALSFELKAGRLKASDLINRTYAIVASVMRSQRKEGNQASPLALAQQCYPEAKLDDTILSDETLTDLLVKGVINVEKIRSELDRSSHFIAVADEPAWRTVWHAFERTDEEFTTAFAEMERKFAAREYDVTGEILHVLGLRLWLSDVGVITKTRTEIVEEGKRYVNDLYADGRIEPFTQDDYNGVSTSSYGGLGINEIGTAEYGKLYAHLQERRADAARDQHPMQAKELLKEMEATPDLFYRRLNATNSEDTRFYRVPILAALDPDAFVSSFLSCHPAKQRTILIALKERYDHGRLERELPTERAWLLSVHAKLVAASGTMPAMAKHRLTNNIGHYVDPILEATKKAEIAEA